MEKFIQDPFKEKMIKFSDNLIISDLKRLLVMSMFPLELKSIEDSIKMNCFGDGLTSTQIQMGIDNLYIKAKYEIKKQYYD